MDTKKEIYRVVHDFVVTATGLENSEVRPAYGNAPSRPSQDRGMLCSINIINQTPIGQDSRRNVDKTEVSEDGHYDIDETVYGDRNVTASIKTYGDTADDISDQIILALTSSVGISFLNQSGLGYLRHGAVLDISMLVNGNFENRRQISIEFHNVSTSTSVVNAVESAEIYWGYSDGGEIDTVTGTIEVTS